VASPWGREPLDWPAQPVRHCAETQVWQVVSIAHAVIPLGPEMLM